VTKIVLERLEAELAETDGQRGVLTFGKPSARAISSSG
jgi:hypothetical protein